MNGNTIYLGIGSNLNRKHNIISCLKFLSQSFQKYQISPIYESPSFGFKSNDFYNCVVKIETRFNLINLKKWLIKLEDLHGRDRSQPRYSNRTLDIDILLFNDWVGEFLGIKIPRNEILKQAYVLKPLVDIAGNLKHPVTQLSFRDHWYCLKKTSEYEINCIKL